MRSVSPSPPYSVDNGKNLLSIFARIQTNESAPYYAGPELVRAMGNPASFCFRRTHIHPH